MDTRKLRHVDALARHRSYSRAAAALGITQSALTRSIQSLEAELGLRLFDRNRSGVVATAAGRRLAREAEEVLERIRSLERNMALLADGKVGDVSFGMGPLPASIILPGLLSRAAQGRGDLRIRTAVGSVGDLFEALKADALEFVIVAHELAAGTAFAQIASVGWVELAPLVRRGHPLAGRRVTDRDLGGYPVIGGSPLDPAGSARHPTYRPTIICDNYETLRTVALDSDAIWIAATCLAGRDLVPLRGASIGQPNELVAIALTGRTLSPVASQLIEECKSRIAQASAAATHRARPAAKTSRTKGLSAR